jgi:uncharacterized protein YcaQ
MPPPLIANAEARKLLLHLQGLAFPLRRRLTRDGLLDLVDHLGYVQLDSINTVERAHHLILFSRNQTYRREHLADLLERRSALFENWTHDAAVIPTRFYPYWKARFVQERAGLRDRWRKWRRDGFEQMLDQVLARVRDGGPVMARDLGGEQKKGADGWWDWHPSKTALEYLWRTGELAVARRDGFQKVYDLTERVIPARYLDGEPAREVYVDWACNGALDRLGLAKPGDLAQFWGGVTPQEAAAWCRGRLGNGLIEVLVEAADGSGPRPAYARETLPETLRDLPPPPKRIRVLSPFDPLLRDRARTERLFDFRYRIEVFVPEARRQYGYYVFPLLEGDRLIGRIDMKHRRDAGALAVKGLWLEPGCKLTRGRRDGLAAELERLRRFIGADQVAFENGYLRTEC